MVKEIIQLGDPRLLKTSEKIDLNQIKTQAIQNLAKDLLDTVKKHEDSAAGLSAVQIGELKRIFVVKDLRKEDLFETKTDDSAKIKYDSLLEQSRAEGFEIVINPKVTYLSKKLSTEWEGCMSISSRNQRLFGPVSRADEVRIEYYDLDGKKKNLTAKDFFSHLIQHELDHLNGILFLKYIENPTNIWSEDDLDDYLSKYNRFPKIK